MKLILTGMLMAWSMGLIAQTNFPELIYADLPGAPKLSKPFLVMGGTQPVKTEKHGLAAPLLTDWNKDGKNDLLLGEFETSDTGSTVRVYYNTGSNKKPSFTSQFEYAKTTTGVNMAIPEWCCIGFTPQLVDLNNDGYQDIITGMYSPGEIVWFRGSKEGYLPGIKLKQAGSPSDRKNNSLFNYFVYSSATFGDLDGDGLSDLITGGPGGLRWSKNTGTKTDPAFGYRNLLLDVNGEILNVMQYDHADSIIIEKYGKQSPSGDSHTSPFAVDWDQDGVLDLLVTNSFRNSKLPFVSFFRGVKSKGQIRFQPGVPLFTGKDGKKPFPGSGPRISVGDWNNDGVPDLIIGASVATLNDGVFDDHLSWTYEDITNIQAAGKDAGEVSPEDRAAIIKRIEADSVMKKYYLGNEGKIEYLSLRHQGYVYVMLGTKNTRKAVPAYPGLIKPIIPVTAATPRTDNEIVNYTVNYVKEPLLGSVFRIKVNFEIEKGWHIYAPTSVNTKQGMLVTKLAFKFPKKSFFELLGDVEMPEAHVEGLTEIFEEKFELSQYIAVPSVLKRGTYNIECIISYQTCNNDHCLPPQEETVVLPVTIK